MAAAKEKPGSRITAWIAALLLFLLAAGTAPAQADCRSESCTGENSARNAGRLLSPTLETLRFHGGNPLPLPYDAAGDSFAPKNGPNTARLTTRAEEIHGALDPIAAKQRTTAVLETSGGDIIGGGARDLNPAQRALLKEGEIASKLPGAHAEVTALQEAAARGLKPKAISTTRDFCPECRKALEEAGATITGPRTAVWK